MKHLSTTLDIAAPPDRIWMALRDVEHWSEWTSTISSIRRLDSGPFVVGSRAIVRQPKLLPARWQVTNVEEGRGFTWITAGPWAAGNREALYRRRWQRQPGHAL